jgi:hypothetical protein
MWTTKKDEVDFLNHYGLCEVCFLKMWLVVQLNNIHVLGYTLQIWYFGNLYQVSFIVSSPQDVTEKMFKLR